MLRGRASGSVGCFESEREVVLERRRSPMRAIDPEGGGEGATVAVSGREGLRASGWLFTTGSLRCR